MTTGHEKKEPMIVYYEPMIDYRFLLLLMQMIIQLIDTTAKTKH